MARARVWCCDLGYSLSRFSRALSEKDAKDAITTGVVRVAAIRKVLSDLEEEDRLWS